MIGRQSRQVRNVFLSILWLAAFCGLAYFSSYIFKSISQRVLIDNDKWIAESLTDRGQREDKRLFTAAITSGMILYNPRKDRFSVVTKQEFEHTDSRPNLFLQSPGSNNYPTAEILLRKMWRSRGPGLRIRKQLEAYNLSSGYAAVRDSTGRLLACITDTAEREAGEKCRDSPWIPFLELSSGPGGLASATALSGDEPELRVFGGLAADQIPNFRNWKSVAAEELTGRRLVFEAVRATKSVSASRYYIDVIGERVKISNGKGKPITPKKRITFCFDEEGSSGLISCAGEQSDRPVVTRFVFAKNPVKKGVQIALTPLKPKRAVAKELPSIYAVMNTRGSQADRKQILGRDTNTSSYELTRNVRLECKKIKTPYKKRKIENKPLIFTPLERPSANGTDRNYCFLKWHEQKLLRALAPRTKAIDKLLVGALEKKQDKVADTKNSPSSKQETSDLVVSNLKNGGFSLSPKAVALGLASVFGQSSQQPGSLLETLSSLKTEQAGRTQISIDLKFQQIAASHFTNLLVNKKGPGGIASGIERKYDSKRRAGFVAIDLSDSNFGEILAATGYPQYRGNLSAWDIEAIRVLRPAENPLAAHAWRHPDARYTPGSVFKLVSALSLIDASVGLVPGLAQEKQQLAGEALTGLSSQQHNSSFGLKHAATSFPIPTTYGAQSATFPVHDAGTNSISSGKAKISKGACRSTNEQRAAKLKNASAYGVCEAIIRSSNMWFSSVILGINSKAISDLEKGPLGKDEALTIISVLDRLFPKRPIPIIAINGVNPARSSSLVADGPVLELARLSRVNTKNRQFIPLEAGLNAYGQMSVNITPLVMAAIAGTIATERIVEPVIARDKTLPRARSLYGPGVEKAAKPYLKMIREGMRGVVNSPAGTAYKSFHSVVPKAKSIAQNVAGKTGTATLGIKGLPKNVEGSWFVGYLSRTGRNDRKVPAIAFACAISHVSKGGSRVCASLTAAILADYSKIASP